MRGTFQRIQFRILSPLVTPLAFRHSEGGQFRSQFADILMEQMSVIIGQFLIRTAVSGQVADLV